VNVGLPHPRLEPEPFKLRNLAGQQILRRTHGIFLSPVPSGSIPLFANPWLPQVPEMNPPALSTRDSSGRDAPAVLAPGRFRN
jgi:hypothetical protein